MLRNRNSSIQKRKNGTLVQAVSCNRHLIKCALLSCKVWNKPYSVRPLSYTEHCYRGWLFKRKKKKRKVKLICILKGLNTDMGKFIVLPTCNKTADVFPWQQCVKVRHCTHWTGGRLNGIHLCWVYIPFPVMGLWIIPK